jgi:plastocyanin
LRLFIQFRGIAVLSLASALCAASLPGRVRIGDSSNPHQPGKSDLTGVVVWLSPAAGQSAPLLPKHVVMLQKNKMFTPHVLPIAAGSTVEFPNADPIFHNAFSNFNGQIFDIGLYPPGSTRSVVFARPGIVRVFCNIHPAMSAVIIVIDSPFFTTTARDGSFSFLDVPPGSYSLHFFHERATTETLNSLTRTVNVPAISSLGTVVISETGYLPMPHKNKYGNDYPPHSGEPRYGLPQ